jgi:predicted dienelactone hydrolase
MNGRRRARQNRLGLLLAALLAADAASASTCAAPHAVGTTQPTLIDAARDNRAVATRVHYPASSAGAGTPAVTGCGFPVIAFGHGFTIGNSAYSYLADALAEAGFIVILPGSEGGLSPDHAEFGRDLAFVGDALVQTSPWNLAAGPGRAIGGHSMGGGAAVLGVAEASSIDALFAFAPANTNPSAIAAAANITAPALLITGSRDCVTPSANHASPIFVALATPAELKQQIDIEGGSHCQFTSGSFTCSIGETSCGGSATISVGSQQSQTLALLIPWLRQQFTPADLLVDGFE